MAMSAASLPSLLVFGPQTELPPQNVLQGLRDALTRSPRLSVLREAADQLPQFWQGLVGFDPDLGQVPGAKHLGQFRQWLKEGGSFPFPDASLLKDPHGPHTEHGDAHPDTPNHIALALSVLIQITQYDSYLDSLKPNLGDRNGNDDAHGSLLAKLRSSSGAGVQGFCVGFLSAAAVAVSETEAQLGRFAAVALRLAVCIGAYVDRDGMHAQLPAEYTAVAIRWRQDDAESKTVIERIVRSIPTAYISSINDDTSVSVTVRAGRDLDDLTNEARSHSLRITAVPVSGRFHSPGYAKVVERLASDSALLAKLGLDFPHLKDGLQLPLRNTADTTIISSAGGSSLTRLALENTLLNAADWFGTLTACLQKLPLADTQPLVAFAGFGKPQIPASLLQDRPTIQVLLLGNIQTSQDELNSVPNGLHSTTHLDNSPDLSRYPPHSIAVVGMAGRFPGAQSVDELWELIMEGKSMVEPAPVERLALPQTGEYASRKWWGNFLKDPDAFDHKFFKKASREALAWDPQQRILLEVVYEALESAGYFGARGTPKDTLDYGCYMGAVMSDYYDCLSCHPSTAYATVGTSRAFVSGCMSHYFGWTGPSLSIDTACSSSLVAINTACRAIWSGECSRAVAGGTNVISSPFDHINLAAAGFLSPSGQCKPFDADADGYCRGEAVAVVVLKRLEDAVKENDNILGVITGSAVNQNHNYGHIAAPNSDSQADLYRNVTRMSRVKPESVTYVEAHGPGTGVGDPIEVRSIMDAFGGAQRDALLHFGSIKGNIGHTEATAGVAGLIKVLLMMKHKTITAQASHKRVNPKIPPFQQHRMAIARSTIPWNVQEDLVACVMSYGAAGSNSAVMVREWKPPVTSEIGSAAYKAQQVVQQQLSTYPLFISAGSPNALSEFSKKLLRWLKSAKAQGHTDLLASLTFNLADRGNHTLPHVLATTVSSLGDVESKLESVAASESSSPSAAISTPPKESPPIALVFGGQESDFIGLSKDIYRSSKVFRKHLDSVNDLLISTGLGGSFYPAVFQSEPIQDLVTLHSALFAVQYASAMAWIDSGLKVSAVIGHSFGQLTAFCVSGTLSLADALKLVAGRAFLMQQYWGPEPGSMIFIRADRATVERMLSEVRVARNGLYAEIACLNGPESHVVVGSSDAVEFLQQHIEDSSPRTTVKKLKVTNGFHSKFTEPMLPHLTALAEQLEWRTPEIHLETTDELETNISPDFRIVSEHTRRPVFFQQAVERLVGKFSGRCTWIEAGRGSSVIQLVKQSVASTRSRNSPPHHAFHSPQLTSSANALTSLCDITVELWKAGYSTQFWPFHRSQKQEYEYLSLPPIQFDKFRHWLGYTGRSSVKEEVADAVRKVQEVEETHELFARLDNGSNKNEAVFKIDPQADRFKKMLAGHVMGGQSLAPASLYFEVVARAALLLQNDTEARTYVPTVDHLIMKSPIGTDIDKQISLVLKKQPDDDPTWAFSITTRPVKFPNTEPFEVSTGRVTLKKRADRLQAREFERFETLTGHRRIEQLVGHAAAEKMQGNHIYRAWGTVVYYGEPFHGIKDVACLGLESAGTVRITPDVQGPVDQRLVDTPMTDSFMQFAGLMVNYFNNASILEDVVYVCGHIEHIEVGGGFDPDAGEWQVYATMSEAGKPEVVADAYVFDSRTKKMVMAVFGLRFSKMSKALLTRMLKSVNSATASAPLRDEKPATAGMTVREAHHAAFEQPQELQSASSPPAGAKMGSGYQGKRRELLQILSDITDVPLGEITDQSTLDDLGVDSLMATEVLNDMRSILGITIDLSTFLFFPNIGAIVSHVDEKLGFSPSDVQNSGHQDTAQLDSSDNDAKSSGTSTPSISTLTTASTVDDDLAVEVKKLRPAYDGITSAWDAFQETRLNYDKLAETAQAGQYWETVLPQQKKLVLAYVVEAFAGLGCDLTKLQAGDLVVPRVKTLDRHTREMRQLYHILEDGRLVVSSGPSFARTSTPVDATAAETIYQRMVGLYPQHDSVNKLVRAVGSKLATCLQGGEDALQILFGSRDSKKLLQDLYEFSPLFRAPTLVLGDFLSNWAANGGWNRNGKLRILELGGGTGGTTRYILKHLESQGIDFEYVFTDLSASLVSSAEKQFKAQGYNFANGTRRLSFDVLDVEKPPKPEFKESFHCIIASNTIHATRDLDVSLRNIRSMLRDDGMLALIEITTREMVWLDIVFGLLEGWWLFEDDRRLGTGGREHALVDVEHWERRMKATGFEAASWSDGITPESKTIRVVAGFPRAPAGSKPGSVSSANGMVATLGKEKKERSVKATLETVVYKRVGNLEIHADVYYPLEGEVFPERKAGMPVALMIHGGSHMIFSRKDVRPAQTRLLLNKGFLPVSLDYRLCPEVTLLEGPMVDVCDALEWARTKLPSIRLPHNPGLRIDGNKVVVVGWSSGGQLAMSLAWTAPQRGLPPPAAILSFYAPTNYEDAWWQNPIEPNGAPYIAGKKYDLLEGVQDEAVTSYDMIGAWEEPLADPRSHGDPRCRIILHINWKAQTLPVILKGLPSPRKAAANPDVDYYDMAQPPIEAIRAASPYAHVEEGTYKVPTFFVHGTADDLIPWQQSQGTYQAMRQRGLETGLVLVEGAPHICDLSGDLESEGWKAVVEGYEFICDRVE